jgi:hypothetical protein
MSDYNYLYYTTESISNIFRPKLITFVLLNNFKKHIEEDNIQLVPNRISFVKFLEWAEQIKRMQKRII